MLLPEQRTGCGGKRLEYEFLPAQGGWLRKEHNELSKVKV